MPLGAARRVWEPPGWTVNGSTAVDDAGYYYPKDRHYWNFCGPGSATVAAYYFANSNPALLSIAPDSYQEPSWVTPNVKTYWKATNGVIKGRGLLMYFAEDVAPDDQFAHGIIKWSDDPVATTMTAWRKGVNWVVSGQTNYNYFYVTVSAANLTQSSLLSKVESDVGVAGVPVMVAVATGDGTLHLKGWTTATGVDHAIAIIGYNTSTSEYTYIDTCGPGCNNTGTDAGVHTVYQSLIWTLLQAESTGDGINW